MSSSDVEFELDSEWDWGSTGEINSLRSLLQLELSRGSKQELLVPLVLKSQGKVEVLVQSSLESGVIVDLSLGGNLEIGSLWGVGELSSENVLVLGIDSSDGQFSGWDSVDQFDLVLDGLSLELEVEVEVISVESQDSVVSLESEIVQSNRSNQSVEEVVSLGEDSLSDGISTSRAAGFNSGVIFVVVSEVVSSESPFELIEFA